MPTLQLLNTGALFSAHMPKSILIRSAVLEDSEGIAKVHTRSWQSAYRGILPDEWLDNLKWQDRKARWDRQLPPKDFSTVMVAINPEKEIIGFASIGPTRDEDLDPEESFELYAIYLSPEYWKIGAGKKLLSAMLERIPSYIEQLTLWVLKNNQRGRAFYESQGFIADRSSKMADIGEHQYEEIRYRLELRPKLIQQITSV